LQRLQRMTASEEELRAEARSLLGIELLAPPRESP
jgi:hypothetical protein